MGLLDSLLGGVLGGTPQQGGAGALINIVAGMLANQGQGGGLAGLAEQFQRGGLGDVMNSWIGTGQNLPVSPDQLGGALGDDLLGSLTQSTGMNGGDLLGQLSQMLPQVVDQLTPNGQLPQGQLDVGAVLGQLLGR